jgi:salicylate hydroxylase
MHSDLQSLVFEEDGEGTPAKLYLGSTVESCCPASGSLSLTNGETFKFDIIVVADGINVKSN